MTSEISRIGLQLRNALDGDAWHGLALTEALEWFDSSAAASRPVPRTNTTWEIVLHVTIWLETVAGAVEGAAIELTDQDQWPGVPETTADTWRGLLVRLRQAHLRLQHALVGITDADLTRRVNGKAYDMYFMLHGVIQHTIYHTGQVVLQRRALERQAEGA